MTMYTISTLTVLQTARLVVRHVHQLGSAAGAVVVNVAHEAVHQCGVAAQGVHADLRRGRKQRPIACGIVGSAPRAAGTSWCTPSCIKLIQGITANSQLTLPPSGRTRK